ncbi:YncE family protein [Paenibacillus aestuarii]|uniref:YncE family protein n=1 Tax=Paenibacillus aestuarii TaxID=516965 RepID=A0ABW0K7W7_9BACL|nr:YncE family protein [Paenibacillus aestuarii]
MLPKALLNSRVKIKVTEQRTPSIIAIIPVSGQVGDIALNPATNRVYVIQSESGLGVLDTTTNKMITNVNTGQMPSNLRINPRTNHIYVSNWLDGSVSVINGRTNRVITTIKVGERCDEIAINTRTNKIYAATISLSSRNGMLTVINGQTNRIQKRMPFIGRPSTIVTDEETNRIYVTNTMNNTVSVLDGNKNTIIKTVKVGRNPVITPALNKKSNCLYIPNNLSRYCSILNLRTNIVHNLQLGRLQSDIIVNPVTNRIYITSAQIESKGRLYVIDGDTNRVIQTKTIPTFTNMFINPNTNHLYISADEENGPDPLTVYQGSSLKRIASLPPVESTGGVAINPLTNRIYLGGEKKIFVIQD